MVTSNRLFSDQLQELITSTRVNIFRHFLSDVFTMGYPTHWYKKLVQMPYGLRNFESKLTISSNMYFFRPFSRKPDKMAKIWLQIRNQHEKLSQGTYRY